MLKKHVKSPINYLGNKNRMLDFIYNNLPSEFENTNFIDVFAGTGTVGINSNFKNIYLNDSNVHMINFLKLFKKETSKSIIENVEKIIKEFKLDYDKKLDVINFSHRNKENYMLLRDEFNKNYDIYKLLTLIFYGFNNQIRFNSNGNYNIPIGKSMFNIGIRKKIFEFGNKLKKLNTYIFNCNFTDFIDKILEEDKFLKTNSLFYFDPPYLISDATYNIHWDENDEKKLLSKIEMLSNMGYKIMLSNVIENKGKINKILKNWIKKNGFKTLKVNINYDNSNYQRIRGTKTLEVLIINY